MNLFISLSLYIYILHRINIILEKLITYFFFKQIPKIFHIFKKNLSIHLRADYMHIINKRYIDIVSSEKLIKKRIYTPIPLPVYFFPFNHPSPPSSISNTLRFPMSHWSTHGLISTVAQIYTTRHVEETDDIKGSVGRAADYFRTRSSTFRDF